jgi:hypothetical protein
MESILEVNDLPQQEKKKTFTNSLYLIELLGKFGIDPLTCMDSNGFKLVRFGCQKEWPFIKIELRRVLSDLDRSSARSFPAPLTSRSSFHSSSSSTRMESVSALAKILRDGKHISVNPCAT